MKKRRTLTLSLCLWLTAGACCYAGTLPAGATILVATNAGISTHATPGRHFTGTVAQTVGDLKAGTHVTGVIVTSRGSRSTTSSSPLTLTLTGISMHRKTVPIKTSSVQPQGAHTTRGNRGSFSFGEDVFPVGTRLEFKLTQPVNL